MQQTRYLTDGQAYYKLKGIAQSVVKDAKKQHWRGYWNTLNKTSKIGKVWKTIKKMSGVETKRSIPTLKEGDLVYDNHQSKAELFAKKFAGVSSTSCCDRFGRGASLYCHRLQLFGRLCVRLPLPTEQFSEI